MQALGEHGRGQGEQEGGERDRRDGGEHLGLAEGLLFDHCYEAVDCDVAHEPVRECSWPLVYFVCCWLLGGWGHVVRFRGHLEYGLESGESVRGLEEIMRNFCFDN